MRELISIFLSLLLLAGNLNLVSNVHLCGGEAVEKSFTLGLQELDCGMAKSRESCKQENRSHTELKGKACCKNLHQLIDCEDDFNSSGFSLPFVSLSNAVFYSVLSNELGFELPSSKFIISAPPFLMKRLRVLILMQVYLL